MKFIKFLGGLLVFISIALGVCAAGGLDNDLCAYKDVFAMMGVSLSSMLIGGIMCTISDNEEEGDE